METIKTAVLCICIITLAQISYCFQGQVNGPSMNRRYSGGTLPFTPEVTYTNFNIIDPIRMLNGDAVSAYSDGWVVFSGKVIAKTNKTVAFEGYFSKHPEWMRLSGIQQFAVINFPFDTDIDDVIEGTVSAEYVALYQPQNFVVMKGIKLRVLNYCQLPNYTYKKPTAEQKSVSDKRLMTWLYSQATNGDASAQCSLGEHYLTGDTGETNKTFAIEWLKASSQSGNIEASNRLNSIEFGTNDAVAVADTVPKK